jgi:hypothetical protein
MLLNEILDIKSNYIRIPFLDLDIIVNEFYDGMFEGDPRHGFTIDTTAFLSKAPRIIKAMEANPDLVVKQYPHMPELMDKLTRIAQRLQSVGVHSLTLH